ncbi:MAG: response regulator transcription factor [Chloroflexi bacterium]|nr:response regulator transcription factor [Chloroflexota bacterium]MBU1750177.1 response regulator transcription factor [Chloroflexota bacterium]
MPHILVVDGDPHAVDVVRACLEAEGCQTSSALNGQVAWQMLRVDAGRPDLVILDLVLPELDGWELCRRIRTVSDRPIIILTACDDDVDQILGLELGADDYITKPFNPRVLAARVRAVLRRYAAGQQPSALLELAEVRLDPARREVTVGGRPLSLRTREFDLLQAFLAHPGLVLSREQLLDRVWGLDFDGDDTTVNVHVTRLRAKLQGSSVTIEAVRGVGYKLVTRTVSA